MLIGEVKICATTSPVDLRNAVMYAGASAIGLICQPSEHAVTKQTVDMDRARRLAGMTPEPVASVLLPRSQRTQLVIAMLRDVRPDRVQLAESEDPALAANLCGLSDRPAEIAQVIHIDDNTQPEIIDPFLDYVDIIHLDSAGEHPGGNGITHDWAISRAVADRSHEAGKQVILAGGLTALNVAEAIQTVRPDGVDVQSSIKNQRGGHNPRLVKEFVVAARQAFAAEGIVGTGQAE